MEAELTKLQNELNELRARIIERERAFGDRPDFSLGEGDPGMIRWQLDRVALRRLRERAMSIEHVLSRLAAGVSGMCERCGERIHPDRLMVLPDTTLCVRCVELHARAQVS